MLLYYGCFFEENRMMGALSKYRSLLIRSVELHLKVDYAFCELNNNSDLLPRVSLAFCLYFIYLTF